MNTSKQKFALETIIRWYEQNGRDFPWRQNENPFHVLLAEMLLRRTTASAVMRVYPSVIKDAGSPESLSKMDRNNLESKIASLGLQSFEQSILNRWLRIWFKNMVGV